MNDRTNTFVYPFDVPRTDDVAHRGFLHYGTLQVSGKLPPGVALAWLYFLVRHSGDQETANRFAADVVGP